MASGLSTLLSGSSLELPELHTLLDEVWGRVHGDAGRSAARAELVQLFSTRSPEALPTVDGLLAANAGREAELVREQSAKLAGPPPPAAPPPPVKAKYLIIGAGPAGLQLGHFMQRAGRDYLILERGVAPGTAFVKYPRHRQLISINKRFAGATSEEFHMRHDWNSLLSDEPSLKFSQFSEEYYPPVRTPPPATLFPLVCASCFFFALCKVVQASWPAVQGSR